MGDSSSLVYLEEGKCVGCNKCIRNCPVFGANIAYILDGQNKVKIDINKCIHCGECIKVCDHDARKYNDDTEVFFKALENGKEISLIAAPAIRVNFQNYKKLFGYFKSLGAKVIYDVSFGADITTWAYLQKKNITTFLLNCINMKRVLENQTVLLVVIIPAEIWQKQFIMN